MLNLSSRKPSIKNIESIARKISSFLKLGKKLKNSLLNNKFKKKTKKILIIIIEPPIKEVLVL
tara:strand:+ start:607 stop:795 length:189 start_codon:yes stop_codon:yes gene_type:complete